ncbi:MAG: OmpH family outer membrane protein [Candidatus Eisenbacteria bacterium]
MKRIPCGLLFVLAISVLFAGAARAQSDVKIGFINSEIILQQYAGTKDAEATFRQDIENWNREARARKSETDRLSQELQQQSPMLSDEKRREKEEDYQRRITEYDKFVQSIWGQRPGRAAQRGNPPSRHRRIQRVLTKLAEDDGYDLILDAADGNILYADPSLDLTQTVLDL